MNKKKLKIDFKIWLISSMYFIISVITSFSQTITITMKSFEYHYEYINLNIVKTNHIKTATAYVTVFDFKDTLQFEKRFIFDTTGCCYQIVYTSLNKNKTNDYVTYFINNFDILSQFSKKASKNTEIKFSFSKTPIEKEITLLKKYKIKEFVVENSSLYAEYEQ
ncbi:MAG TPA: hypothetical protein PLF48_04545 [Chitinophagales bacterium]|nr:hypothetical protein [Chitinophagales bacterium]